MTTLAASLWRATLEQAAELVRTRAVSPVELAESCLARIAELEPGLNAFILVARESALTGAQAAEREIAAGNYRGPLHGIPLSVKDLFDVAGVPTTAGSGFPAEPAAHDSAVVERLRAGGAVLLGKTGLHELAFGVTSQNPHFGPITNPWARDRSPGGSSGGSAAAVATGGGFGSIGSDTGGSIRIPAALCGIVGLKPTRGRVSLRGAIPLSWTLDHAGPLARTVRDAAVLYAAIAGDDARDPGSRSAPYDDPLAEIDKGAARLRIGIWKSGLDAADADVRIAVDEAIKALASSGARVESVDLPRADELAECQRVVLGTEAYAYHRERVENEPERFGADVLERLRRGKANSGHDYAAARRARSEIRTAFDALFGSLDALALPTTVVTAPLREGADAVATAARLTSLTSPFNLTGLPAISVPCGHGVYGLPVGLQLVGRRWGEARLLRIARAYEVARGDFPWPEPARV